MGAWIGVVDEPQATGRLRDIFDETKKQRGSLANIYKVQAPNPDALVAHREMYMALFSKDGALTKREKEMIATVVSRANASEYCLAHHADAFGRHATEPGLPALLATDHMRAQLSPKERALVEYAVKLTRAPGSMGRSDVEDLKKHGYEDAHVLDAAQVAAFVNYLNRMANGLGLTHEDVGKSYRY